LALLAASCEGDGAPGLDAMLDSSPGAAGSAVDSGRLPDDGSTLYAPDGAGSDADGGGSETFVPRARVRFLVLGDGGTGDAHQKKVAAVMHQVCAARGCDFVLYLGDNIYEDGVTGPTDEQFRTKFEEPYADLDLPFYVALGNHDYGSLGINLFPEDAKSAAQVEYSAHSAKWNMPHYYYTFREGPVAFFALDTNAILIDLFRPLAEQKAWLDAELSKSDAPWKIVFGHHPYISNGEHGNAGDYRGAVDVELHDGAILKAFIEESVCGKADVYFSGHDHDREWLQPTCGTSFIVSGAAAKLTWLWDRGSASRWADDQKRGFLWVEADASALTGVFYDEDGTINFEDVVRKSP
jgi:hypothetical protein